jgi:hypothetical protein
LAAFHFKCRARSWTDRRLERSKVTASAITRNPPTQPGGFVSVNSCAASPCAGSRIPRNRCIGCGYAADNDRGAGSGPRALALLGRPALVDAGFSELFRDPIHSTLLTVELCYGGVTAIPAADLDCKGAVGGFKDFILRVAHLRNCTPRIGQFPLPSAARKAPDSLAPIGRPIAARNSRPNGAIWQKRPQRKAPPDGITWRGFGKDVPSWVTALRDNHTTSSEVDVTGAPHRPGI